jgi:hypothetical protein
MLTSMNDEEQRPQDLKGVRFIGTVVDNADPNHMFRIRVDIPNMFEGDPAVLPWVSPSLNGLFPNSPNGSYGTFGLVPPLGSTVYVFFDQGEPNSPFYDAFPVSLGSVPSAGITNYGKRYGFTDPEGNTVFIDTTPGASPKLNVSLANGTAISVSSVGNVAVNTPGDITATAGGKADITSSGILTLTGSTVKIAGTLVINGVSYLSHTHSGVVSGGSVSGGVV